MTTYTSHGTHCDTCNRLADTAHAAVKETGRPYTETTYIGSTTHHVASSNNGINKRITGDENPERLYQS